MRRNILVGIGGFLGAISRYSIGRFKLFNYKGEFPLNTLIINLIGSLILAFILYVAFELSEAGEDIKVGFTTGFLGAFTTFSTFCKETVLLMSDGFYIAAISYILLSLGLGLIMAFLGTKIARLTTVRAVQTDEIFEEEVV